jgi:hypothetical protein
VALFSNFSTRAKLVAGFGLIVVLLAGVSTLAYQAMGRLEASQRALFEDDLTVAFDAMSLRNALNHERAAMLSMLVAEPGMEAPTRARLADSTKRLAAAGDKVGGAAARRSDAAASELMITHLSE